MSIAHPGARPAGREPRGDPASSPCARLVDCPSEGDGRWLGRAPRAGARRSAYLAAVATRRRARRRGRDPDPHGDGQRLVRARTRRSWRAGPRRRRSPAITRRIRLLVAVNPAALRARARRPSGRDARADRARGGSRSTWSPAAVRTPGYGAPPLDHAGRYARLARLADALRARFARAALPGRRQRGRRGAGLPGGRHVPDVGRAARARSRRAIARGRGRRGRAAHADRAAHPRDRPDSSIGRPAPRRPPAVSRRGRRRPGVRVRGVRQRRPGPDERDRRRRRGLGGARAVGRHPSVRGGAGTALVGSHARVADCSAEYRDAGVDLVIGRATPTSGGRAGRHGGVAAGDGARRRRAGPPARGGVVRRLDPRPPGRATSWPSASARRSTLRRRPDGGRGAGVHGAAGPDVTVAYSMKSNTLMGLVGPAPPRGLLGRGGLGVRVPHGPAGGRARREIVFNGPPQERPTSYVARCARAPRSSPTASSRCARSPASRRAPPRGADRPAPGAAGPGGPRPVRRARAAGPGGRVDTGPRRAAAQRPAHPPRRLPARPAAARRARRSTA